MKKILGPGSKIKNMAPTNCSQGFSDHEHVLFIAIHYLVPKLLSDLGCNDCAINISDAKLVGSNNSGNSN
jgi:hypothetical protein